MQKVWTYLCSIFNRQTINIVIKKEEKTMSSFLNSLEADLASVDTSTPGHIGLTISIGGLPTMLNIPVKDANIQAAVQVAQSLAPVIAAGHVSVGSALLALVSLFHVSL